MAKGLTPTLALLTDGRANIALDGTANRPQTAEDAQAMAKRAYGAGVQSLVIDVSKRTLRTLADCLHAPTSRCHVQTQNACPKQYPPASALSDELEPDAGPLAKQRTFKIHSIRRYSLACATDGAGGATQSWRNLMPLLTKHYRCTAMDLPGQGFTPLSPRGRAGLDVMAKDVQALTTDLGLNPVATIAHSAGVPIALRMHELNRGGPPVIAINAALSKFDGVAGWLFPLTAKSWQQSRFPPSVRRRQRQSREYSAPVEKH